MSCLKQFRVVVSAVLCLLGVCTAQAALISTDDVVFGTGAITLDTATGLEWLDLTKSTDLSFNFVSSQLYLGGQFYGYRYALNSEIGALWTNAGILISEVTDGNLYPDPANIAPIEALQTFIGITHTIADVNVSQGISGTIFAGNYPHLLPLVINDGLTAPMCCEENIGGWIGSEHLSTVGSWLVRGVPPPSPPVGSIPEPETYAMLLAGLGLMGFIARRRKQAA